MRISFPIKANSHFDGTIVTDPLLRERFFGEFEGRPFAEYASHPKYDGWPGTFTAEGGETWEQVKLRATKFFKVRTLQ